MYINTLGFTMAGMAGVVCFSYSINWCRSGFLEGEVDLKQLGRTCLALTADGQSFPCLTMTAAAYSTGPTYTV